MHGERVDFPKDYRRTKHEHNRIIEIAQQVVQALRRIHSVGFVHWDVKPQNILYSISEEQQVLDETVSNQEKFTLIDFGIWSKYLDENGDHIKKQKVSKFRGSVEFWAAEVLAQYSKFTNYSNHEKSNLNFRAYKEAWFRVTNLYNSSPP